MMRWSSEEDEILRRLSGSPVARIRDELYAHCKRRRSADAIKRRMSRLGLSRREYVECRECHRSFLAIKSRWGLCPECVVNVNRRKAEETYRMALTNHADSDVGAERERRIYDRYRKRISRLK